MKHAINIFSVFLLLIYFEFLPARFITKTNTSLNIEFYSKIKDPAYSHFLRVRPVAQNALVFIQDSNSAWINANAVWTQMPGFAQNLKIKPLFSGETFLLRFDILDTKTGKIYQTPTKKIWGLLLPDNLLSRLVTSIPLD